MYSNFNPHYSPHFPFVDIDDDEEEVGELNHR